VRILLVEDEEELGDTVRQGLEAIRYRVDWAQDGNEGLELSVRGSYDLLIT
jgi:DNA-binding response OmpR family regulator